MVGIKRHSERAKGPTLQPHVQKDPKPCKPESGLQRRASALAPSDFSLCKI